MIDHVSIEVADLARATVFYDSVLKTLGFERLVTRDTTVGYGKTYPEFWLNARAGGGSARTSGFHVALRCRETTAVEAFHAAALEAGGHSDGEPGLRPDYGDRYFAAFILDPDGNRIETVTFVDADAS